jgi:hypothetical protein
MSANLTRSGAVNATISPAGVKPCPGVMVSSVASPGTRFIVSPVTMPVPIARPRSAWRARK